MSRSLTRRVSLLIRNLPLDVRQDDVRRMFERYGEVRDVYLPTDYYTRTERVVTSPSWKPKGFGFVEFMDNRDAEDALYALDRTMVGGREISVVMSKESRKTPRDMIKREEVYRGGDRRGGGGRSRSRSHSRERGGRDRDADRGYSSRDRGGGGGRSSYRSRSRSRGRDSRRDRSASRSQSRSRSRSRSRGGDMEARRGSRSPSPQNDDREAKRSASPARNDDDERVSPRRPHEDSPPHRHVGGGDDGGSPRRPRDE